MPLTPTAAALHVGTLVHHLLTPLADRTLPKRHHGYGSTELALLAPGPAGLALTGPGVVSSGPQQRAPPSPNEM